MPKRKQLDSDQMITNKKLCESSENGSQDDGDPDSDVIVKTEVDIEFDESVDNDPLCEPNESNELNLAALSDNFLKEILGLVRNIEQRQKIMEKQQKYMQKQIVSRLDRLNLDVIAVRNEVLSLRGKPIEEQPWNPSIIPNTPFSEAEDFEAFEKIIEDKEAFNQTITQRSNLNYSITDASIQEETLSAQTFIKMEPSPSTTTTILDSATSSAIQSLISDACQKSVEKVEERNKLLLLRLTEEIQGLRKDVNELKKAVSLTNSTILPIEPFSSVDDFLRFEKAVQEDIDKFSLLKADLKRWSTSSSRKFVTKSWQKLMDDKVAESFSWRGTADKKCIRAFAVATAIRQTFICDNGGKEEDFVFASKSFFQYAKNRIKVKTTTTSKKDNFTSSLFAPLK